MSSSRETRPKELELQHATTRAMKLCYSIIDPGPGDACFRPGCPIIDTSQADGETRCMPVELLLMKYLTSAANLLRIFMAMQS
jgi:hypothetical protein